jgi:hypothetical protein
MKKKREREKKNKKKKNVAGALEHQKFAHFPLWPLQLG